jgi:hypothetical protein
VSSLEVAKASIFYKNSELPCRYTLYSIISFGKSTSTLAAARLISVPNGLLLQFVG